MKQLRFKSSWIFLAMLVYALTTSHVPASWEEGGYAGQEGEGHETVIWNFVKHFSYEDYYYDDDYVYTTSNNNFVDNMDIALFAGHGNKWLIATKQDGTVWLPTCGDNSNKGWGSRDLEFIAFESCYVVPRPCDVSSGDWWTNWIQSDAPFDGLHQALGFGTVSYQSTDQNVSNYFGDRLDQHYGVWETWFDAINSEARSDEKGSAVMHPSSDGESYPASVSDPSENHSNLRIWYQTGHCQA